MDIENIKGKRRGTCLPDRPKFAEKIKELFCSNVVAISEYLELAR
jgi:hypothetical protein